MRKYLDRSNDENLEDNFEVEEETSLPLPNEDSGYIAVRRITYGKNPVVKVLVGAMVPNELVEDAKIFSNLLSKGAIKRGN